MVAEDQHLLREGLVAVLSARGFEIAAAVESGPELQRSLLKDRPDVAVVDVRLPPTFTDEGLQVALAARQQVPGLPILVLSQHVEQLYARQLLTGGGGVGYLLKDRVLNAGQFVDAVLQVASGGTVMDPEVINQLLARNAHNGPLNRLTPREQDVLTLMAEGCSNAAIAHQLHLSNSAVSKHTTSIFAKLDLASNDDDNRRVLAVLAYLDGRGT